MLFGQSPVAHLGGVSPVAAWDRYIPLDRMLEPISRSRCAPRSRTFEGGLRLPRRLRMLFTRGRTTTLPLSFVSRN